MRARLLVVSAIAGAFVCGWLFGAERSGRRNGSANAAPERIVEPSPNALEVSAARWGACPPRASLDPGERSALVREITESIRAIVEGHPEAHPSPEPSSAAEVTPHSPVAAVPRPDAVTARKEANEIVDRALAAQIWTDSDRAAFFPLEHRLDPSDFQEVIRGLNQAMNAGRIAVRTQGPPF
jgi:hypothetical protein